MKTLSLFLFSLILACSNTSENSSSAPVEYLMIEDAEMLDRSYEISEKPLLNPLNYNNKKLSKREIFGLNPVILKTHTGKLPIW